MTYTLHLKTERRVMSSNGKSNGNGSNGDEPKRGFMNPNKGSSVPLATLYERINAKGVRYLAGRIGHSKVLIFETDATDERRGERVWQMVLAEGPYPPDGVQAQAGELEEERAAR